jgi:hypothetical protein
MVSGICGTHGGGREYMFTLILFEKLLSTRSLGRLSTTNGTILKQILDKQVVKVFTGFNWLRLARYNGEWLKTVIRCSG